MCEVDAEQIAGFLIGIRQALYEGGTETAPSLPELHRVIQRLMDATPRVRDQDLRVLLASLEHEARLCKQEIERGLGVRN